MQFARQNLQKTQELMAQDSSERGKVRLKRGELAEILKEVRTPDTLTPHCADRQLLLLRQQNNEGLLSGEDKSVSQPEDKVKDGDPRENRAWQPTGHWYPC